MRASIATRFPLLDLSNLAGATGLVLVGAVSAQMIHIGSLPVISRLYGPADVGMFQVAASAMATLLPLTTLKFEFAMFRVRDPKRVTSLLLACLVIVGIVAIGTPLAGRVGAAIGIPVAAVWTSWMLIVLLIGGGTFQAVWPIAVRDSRHGPMALAKPVQAGTFNLAAIVAGLGFTVGAGMLVISDALSRLASSGVILRDWVRRGRGIPAPIGLRRTLAMLRRYRRYPVFSVPSGIVGSLAVSLPVFWLAWGESEELAGQFAMAWRSAFMPLSMLVLAVNQVVNGRLSAMLRSRTRGMSRFVLRVSLSVMAVGVLPVLGLIVAGEPALTLFLGAEWHLAGRMLEAMVPLLLSILVSGPIGMVLVIVGRPGLQLAWDIGRVGLISIAFGVSAVVDLDPVYTVLLYSLAMLSSSLVFLFLALIVTGSQQRV